MGQASSSHNTQITFFKTFQSQFKPIELKGEQTDGQIYVCDTNQEMIIEIPNTIIDQESDEQWHQSQAMAYTSQAPNIITYYGSSEKQSKEMCSSYSLILGYYEFVPHNVQKEINSRKYNQEGFAEKEIWYLLWYITSALYELKQKGYNHKDLRPTTIGLKKNGVIKLCPVGLLPHQKNSVARFITENQQAYLPPSLKQQLIQGTVPSIKWNRVDSFALGNTLLDLMLLEVPTIVDKHQIGQLCSHCYQRYSQQIVRITEGLMQDNDEQIQIEELYLLLKPYSEKIVNLQEFQINFEDIKRLSIPLNTMSKLRLKFIIESFSTQNNGQKHIIQSNDYHQENHRPQSEIIYESHLQRDTTQQQVQHQVVQGQQNIEIQPTFSNQQINQQQQIEQQQIQLIQQQKQIQQQEIYAQQRFMEQQQIEIQQQQQAQLQAQQQAQLQAQQYAQLQQQQQAQLQLQQQVLQQQQYQQKVINTSEQDLVQYQSQNFQPQQIYVPQPQQNLQQIQQTQIRGPELRQSVSPQPKLTPQPQPQLLQRLLVQSQQIIPQQQGIQQLSVPVPVAMTTNQNSPIDQIKFQQLQIPQQQQYLPPPPQIQQSAPPLQNQQYNPTPIPVQQQFIPQPPQQQQYLAQPVQQQVPQPPPPQLIQRIVMPTQQTQSQVPQQVPAVFQQPTIGYPRPQNVQQAYPVQPQPVYQIMPQQNLVPLSPIGPRVPVQLAQTLSPIDDKLDREVTVLEYKPAQPNLQILKASNRPYSQMQNPGHGDNFDRIRNVLQSSDELLQYNK